MDFKKRLKLRLYLSIGYMALGVLIIVVANITQTDNQFLYTFGSVLLFCGIARARNYFRNTKDEKTIRAIEIRETDERNVEIIQKAKSMAFNIAFFLGGVAVIILQLLGLQEKSLFLSYGVCFSLALYWVCYLIIRKKY